MKADRSHYNNSLNHHKLIRNFIFYVFFCLLFAMPLYASVYMCLVVTCWERADLLALVLWCRAVSLLLSHWYPGSGVVLDCIGS